MLKRLNDWPGHYDGPTHHHHFALACATTLICFWKFFGTWLITTFHFDVNISNVSLKNYLKPFS